MEAKQEVVEKTVAVFLSKHTKLNIVSIHNDYFQEKDCSLIADELNNVQPDFIFVGITSLIKEYLVEYLREAGNNGVFMGV